MPSEANFIFEALSDVWDEYEDRDQILALWEGYLQISSDLILQLFQADLSKSIESIPVFRRYRWLHFDLERTVVPSGYLSAFVFAFESEDDDILNIPYLSDRVRTPDDDEYLQITNSSSGTLSATGELVDLVNAFPVGMRVGDTVRLLSGIGLADEDTDYRFLITRINSSSSVQLDTNIATAASSIRYIIERSPLLQLVENTDYVVSAGKINFASSAVLTPDDSANAFRIVEELAYEGDFVRDDPRTLATGGMSVTNGTGGATAINSGVLEDSSLPAGKQFLTGTTPVALGDYLVVRPSGAQPTQVLTTQIVSKVINIISETELEVEDRFSLTASQLTFDVLRPSSEDFNLVSTEDGSTSFPFSYAIQTQSAVLPSGTTGELVDGSLLAPAQATDAFIESNVATPFSKVAPDSVVGKQLRVLSGTGLLASELAIFTILDVVTTTNPDDTLILERKITTYSTPAALDAVYIVGDVLAVDFAAPTSTPGAVILSDQLEFTQGSSNTSLVTDGTVAFDGSEVLDIQPFIKAQRDRAATASSNEDVPNRLWAEEVVVDQDQVFQNFGFPIQVGQVNEEFSQINSEEYKSVLQGLWFAYWNGPTLDNIIRGLNLVFDLPYATGDGVISAISLPDPAVLEGTVESLTNAPPNTFDTSSGNPLGDARFLSFEIDGQPPVLVTFADDAANPNTTVRDDINLAVGSAVASLTPTGKIRLSALTSVKIDTVIGNPGLGFAPGDEDFGTFNVTILFDDGTSEVLAFGTQFPLSVEVGTRVEKFQPLTQAVGIFDYVSLPGWWDVFGIGKINQTIPTFSQEDKDILNDILKDFTFAVRVVADAFTRLGPVDRDIVMFFLEQIKPTISDYLFIVAETFYDLVTMTDDRDLLSFAPLPSAEYKAQNSGEAASAVVDLTVKNVRNIDWNYSNFYITGSVARAAFEGNSQLGQYDDARLETEDMTVIAPMHIHILDGVGAASYSRAIINGSVSSDAFDTSVQLIMRKNGVTPVVVPVFPSNPMSQKDIIEFINSWYASFLVSHPGLPLPFGKASEPEKLVLLNPDGTLQFYIDDFSGAAPQIEVLVNNPGLGLVISSVFGTATTSGIVDAINAS